MVLVLIASGAFAVSMNKIEDKSLTWSDSRTLINNYLTCSHLAVSGSVTMSPRSNISTQSVSNIKLTNGTMGDYAHTTETKLMHRDLQPLHICVFFVLRKKNLLNRTYVTIHLISIISKTLTLLF